MGIYQKGTKKPKSTSTQKVKGLTFENKYFDREIDEDGMVILRPKANVRFVDITEDEDGGSLNFSVVGMEEAPADSTTSNDSENGQ